MKKKIEQSHCCYCQWHCFCPDVFVRFSEALKKDADKIAGAVQAGEYKGTEQEVAQQMLNDIINHSYELLSAAHQEMEFGE